MTHKKTRLLIYAALAITGAFAIFYVVKATRLEKELADSERTKSELNAKVMEYHTLENIDSLLLEGKYRGALRAYNKEIENKDVTDLSGVQLRIGIAEQLLRLRDGKQSDEQAFAKRDSLDSIQRRSRATPAEIRKYDSLSFALEKAKVQLSGIRRNLRKESFGRYLTFKSAKGDQMHYVGEVKDKQANGSGVAILNTGSRYEGAWKANMRHGTGSFYWADGEYYEGSYVDDRRTGQGTYYWPNGEKYVGQWKDDKRNGKGVFYGAEGEIMTSGLWKDDKLDKPDKD